MKSDTRFNLQRRIIHSLLCLIAVLRCANSQTCFDSRSRVGSCRPLATCPQLIEEYYGQLSASSVAIDFQTFLGNSICGFDGSNFLICCAVVATTPNRRPKEFSSSSTAAPNLAYFHFSSLGGTTAPSPPAYSIPPTFSVFQPTTTTIAYRPNPPGVPATKITCGINSGTTNRVVGGMEARRGAYPWIAALGYFDEIDRSSIKFLCAGSLISQHFVVTSAHCINPSLTLVRLGVHDLSRSSGPSEVDIRIKRTVMHESFDLKSIANDIALVELSSPAPISASIGTICLPDTGIFLSSDFVGMNPFVAGWGAVKHLGPTSQVLRDAQVPIIGRQVCEQNYKSVFKFVEFSDKLICAGNSNVDACQGDSGGPLMMPQLDGSTYRYHLLGIVSFGYECARTGFPGVYTRVAAYLPWIKQHIF